MMRKGIVRADGGRNFSWKNPFCYLGVKVVVIIMSPDIRYQGTPRAMYYGKSLSLTCWRTIV